MATIHIPQSLKTHYHGNHSHSIPCMCVRIDHNSLLTGKSHLAISQRQQRVWEQVMHDAMVGETKKRGPKSLGKRDWHSSRPLVKTSQKHDHATASPGVYICTKKVHRSEKVNYHEVSRHAAGKVLQNTKKAIVTFCFSARKALNDANR